LAKRSQKAARRTDDLVHDHAWTAVGMGVGLGFLMGLLAARTTQPSRESPSSPVEKSSRERPEEMDEGAEGGVWEKFQTILPLAILALKTFQELRGSRGPARREVR